MATSDDGRRPYRPTHRQQHVDEVLAEHDSRISDNERRWLLLKGGVAAAAIIKGADALVNVATTIL